MSQCAKEVVMRGAAGTLCRDDPLENGSVAACPERDALPIVIAASARTGLAARNSSTRFASTFCNPAFAGFQAGGVLGVDADPGGGRFGLGLSIRCFGAV